MTDSSWVLRGRGIEIEAEICPVEAVTEGSLWFMLYWRLGVRVDKNDEINLVTVPTGEEAH